jgi:WhiB family transcriptional regulator, redox-sensing transcriptional regulator
LDWRRQAACNDVDPELFFPVGSAGAGLRQIHEAKRICRRCPVIEPCFRWAMENREVEGVWGGTTEQERRSWWGRPGPAATHAPINGQADGAAARLSISGCSLPYGGREGGDWTDIFPRTDGSGSVLTIGDAMGHGEAALSFQRQLRRAAQDLKLGHSSDVMRAIEQLDRIASGRDGLATYLVASIHLGSGNLSLSRVGHPPPLIIDHRGHCTFAPAPTAGPLGLGIAALPPSDICLSGGSTVVLYTDGLVQRRSLALGEGMARLRSAAAGTHTVPVEHLPRRLLDASDAVGTADDDVTILVARLEPGAGSVSPSARTASPAI